MSWHGQRCLRARANDLVLVLLTGGKHRTDMTESRATLAPRTLFYLPTSTAPISRAFGGLLPTYPLGIWSVLASELPTYPKPRRQREGHAAEGKGTADVKSKAKEKERKKTLERKREKRKI